MLPRPYPSIPSTPTLARAPKPPRQPTLVAGLTALDFSVHYLMDSLKALTFILLSLEGAGLRHSPALLILSLV